MANKQWIVLCADGRHVPLEADRDPNERDIARSRGALHATRQPVWLAVMDGGYYVRTAPNLKMVRPLGDDPGSWDQASAAFEQIRRTVIWPTP